MIQSYNTKPRAILHKTSSDPRGTEYYGIEQEIGCEGLNKTDLEYEYTTRFNSAGFTYHKQDGSLSSVNGFEIVSHPATLAYHMTTNWADRNSFLESKGVKAHDTRQCGLHIHVSRIGMDDNHQLRFALFINKWQPKFEALARRKDVSSGFNTRYFQYYEMNSVSNENDVIARLGLDTFSGYLRNGHIDRYRAVNFENKKTLEVRIFKGTILTSTILASIQLVKAVREFTKNMTVPQLVAANAWTNFCGFVATLSWASELVGYAKHRRVWVDAPAPSMNATTAAPASVNSTARIPDAIRNFVVNAIRTNPDWTMMQVREATRAQFNSRTCMDTIRAIRLSM